MATSTSSSTKKSSNNSANDRRRQELRGIIKGHLDTYFKSTLGTQDDMVNIFLALICLESSFNAGAKGPAISLSSSSGARDYWESTSVQSKLKEIDATIASGTATDDQKSAARQQRANIQSGLKAMGLSQSMGWNHIKGGSKKDGKCLLEKARPDLSDQLCISPGDSLETSLLGESNMSKNVLAGLVVLESKWKACKKVASGWQIGSYVYPLRVSASVSGYLGLGAKDTQTGITPGAYTASIVGGSMYAKANGATSPVIRDSAVQYASTEGPVVATSASPRAQVAGCVAKTA